MRLLIFYLALLNSSALDVFKKDDSYLIIEKARNSYVYRNLHMIDLLEDFLKELQFLKGKNRSDEIFITLCKNNLRVLNTILDSMMNNIYGDSILRLILESKVKDSKKKDISLYSILSVRFTSTIQIMMFVFSNEEYVEKDFKKWDDYFYYFFDEDIIDSYTSCYFDKKGDLKKNKGYQLCKSYCMISIIQLNIDLGEKYIYYIYQNSPSGTNIDNFFDVVDKLELEYLKTNFYQIINDKIKELRVSFQISEYRKYYHDRLLGNLEFYKRYFDEYGDKFYLLLNPNGFAYNRICKIDILNLYLDKNYKTFRKYDDSTTSRINEEYDMTYLEGKRLYFRTNEEYEYVMGLLQYNSELYNKHIILLIEEGSLSIKVIKASTAPIKEILEYYKLKNDITLEILTDIQKNKEKYENMYFMTIVENIEYSFTKYEGYETVYSKCLRLSCSHIIGNELLEEYFNNFSEKCYWCNSVAEIEAYFELNLYKKI